MCQEAGAAPERTGYQRLLATLMVLGAYGFFLMFYLSGAYSVPRRFATYPAELAHGGAFSAIAAVFATVFLVGFLLYLAETGSRWHKAMQPASGGLPWESGC